MADAIELLIEPRDRPVGSGSVRRLLPFRERRMVGPFIFADVMGPDDLGPDASMNVDAHPHIGLSTLTYLLEGRIVHRDSTGAAQTIGPGAVNWMTAGSGVTHTERSHPDDAGLATRLFGLQTWVALPEGVEDGPAGFEHCPVDQVPTVSFGASSVSIAAGSAWGERSPVTGASPLALAEVRLAADAVPLDTALAERAVVAMSGDVRLDGRHLVPGQLAVIDPTASASLEGHGIAMVLGGEPVGRRHIWWNFVHSDPDRVEAAKQQWTDQRFPTVPGDHDPWVPLPG